MRFRSRYLFLGMGAVFLGALFFWRSSTSSSADIEAMRKMGVATNDDEFNARAPNQGTNAADIYRAFGKKLSLMRGPERDAVDKMEELLENQRFPGRPTSAEIQKMMPWADHFAPVAAEMRRAAAMDRCNFGPFESKNGRPAPMDHFADFMNAWLGADILGATALCEAQKGQTVQAIKDLDAACRIFVQIGQNPGTEAFFAAISINIIFGAWRMVLKDHPNDRTMLQQSVASLEGLPNPMDLRQMFFSSYAGYLDSYRLQMADPGKYLQRERKDQPNNYYARFKLQRSVQESIHVDRKTFEWMPQDGNDVAGMIDALKKGDEEAKRHWPLNELPIDSGVRQDMAKFYGNHLAMRRMLLISSRLLLRRSTGGGLPDTLPDFGSGLLDPNTKKPFSYQKVGNGFKLYSPAFVGSVFEFK